MHLLDYILLAVLTVWLLFSLRAIRRGKVRCGGYGGDCAGCAHCAQCHASAKLKT